MSREGLDSLGQNTVRCGDSRTFVMLKVMPEQFAGHPIYTEKIIATTYYSISIAFL